MSEVVTALSSIALRSHVLVCGFSHSLFVNSAFENWERTPPIMADGRCGETPLTWCHFDEMTLEMTGTPS